MYPALISNLDNRALKTRYCDLFDKWCRLSQPDRKLLRKIINADTKVNINGSQIILAIMLLLILGPMAGTVLSAQSQVDRYQPATCSGTNANISWSICVSFPVKICGKAEVTVVSNGSNGSNGSKAILRYPTHTPLLLTWFESDLKNWQDSIKGVDLFTCYLEGNQGVLDPRLSGLWGWVLMAVIAAIAGLAALVLAVTVYKLSKSNQDLMNSLTTDRPDLLEYLAFTNLRRGDAPLLESHVMTYWTVCEIEGKEVPTDYPKQLQTWQGLDNKTHNMIRWTHKARRRRGEHWCMCTLGVILAAVLISISLTLIVGSSKLKSYRQTQCLGPPVNTSSQGRCARASVFTVDGERISLRYPAVSCNLELVSQSGEKWLTSINKSAFTCYVSGGNGVTYQRIAKFPFWVIMLVAGVLIALVTILCIYSCYTDEAKLAKYYKDLAGLGLLHFWEIEVWSSVPSHPSDLHTTIV